MSVWTPQPTHGQDDNPALRRGATPRKSVLIFPVFHFSRSCRFWNCRNGISESELNIEGAVSCALRAANYRAARSHIWPGMPMVVFHPLPALPHRKGGRGKKGCSRRDGFRAEFFDNSQRLKAFRKGPGGRDSRDGRWDRAHGRGKEAFRILGLTTDRVSEKAVQTLRVHEMLKS